MAALYDSSGQRVEQLPANVIPGERVGEPFREAKQRTRRRCSGGEERETPKSIFFAQPCVVQE